MEKNAGQYTEPEHVRRKLAALYRREWLNPKRSKTGRAEFGRMALAWECTCSVDFRRKQAALYRLESKNYKRPESERNEYARMVLALERTLGVKIG